MPWQGNIHDEQHPAVSPTQSDVGIRCEGKVMVTEDIREWDYGEYEGLTSKEVCGIHYFSCAIFYGEDGDVCDNH